jgi:hypothetical protein
MTRSTIDRRVFLSLSIAGAGALLTKRVHGRSIPPVPSVDVVVYGGSSAGVIAAVQARRMGKSVVIVNPYGFLGGMTSSGISSIDVFCPDVVSGLTREYILARAHAHDLWAGVEPDVAEQAFNDMAQIADVTVFHNERLDLERGVTLDGKRIASIRSESGRAFSGKMFIDATYEGDLMAKAGVSYVIGRESNAQYGETINGFQRGFQRENPWRFMGQVSDIGVEDQFVSEVDPFVVRGDPSSGVLPSISLQRQDNGAGDRRVQAYNYRLTLTDDPNNQIPFEKPEGYRELDHELLMRNFEAGDDRQPGRRAAIPNRKIDWNSIGGVGTDLPGASFAYAEAGHETRSRIDRQHEIYTRGHLWTLANHPRVPDSIRKEMRRWGYAKDEFPRNGGFPYMLYLREGRRMVSDYVMTENDSRRHRAAEDPIALASYAMDSHLVQYIVNEQHFVEREGVFLQVGPGPYGVSYRSIVPRQGQCSNLLVPVCLSASHVGYASLRMEPDYMNFGQAAAAAACIAIDMKAAVQKVPYAPLRERLLADGLMLKWQG